jgi:hypothetical protein
MLPTKFRFIWLSGVRGEDTLQVVVILLSVLLRFTASDYPFAIFKLCLFLFGCNVCSNRRRSQWEKLTFRRTEDW